MSIQNMDRKVALVIMFIAVVYLVLSFRLPEYPYALVDADALPKGLGYLLLSLSVILFFQNRPEKDEEKQKRNIKKDDLIILIVTLLSLLLYVFLLEPLGFVISTIVFLAFTIRLYGYKKWITNLVVSIGFSLFLYFSFNYILKVYLPQGIMPF